MLRGGSAGRMRVPQRLACDVDTSATENKGNKNPIRRSQCPHSPGLVGVSPVPPAHLSLENTGKHQGSKAGLLTTVEFINFLKLPYLSLK